MAKPDNDAVKPTVAAAVASALVAGLCGPLVGIAAGALLAGAWPIVLPQLGAHAAAPVAAWVVAYRRFGAVTRPIVLGLAALLAAFCLTWLLAYGLLLDFAVGPLAGIEPPDTGRTESVALIRRFALGASLLNSLLGAALGLLFGRPPTFASRW